LTKFAEKSSVKEAAKEREMSVLRNGSRKRKEKYIEFMRAIIE
jgi:hypothetical protein